MLRDFYIKSTLQNLHAHAPCSCMLKLMIQQKELKFSVINLDENTQHYVDNILFTADTFFKLAKWTYLLTLQINECLSNYIEKLCIIEISIYKYT